jgi:hypothetical protein
VQNDAVSRQGSAFVSLLDGSPNNPPESSPGYWGLLAQAGATDPTGAAGATRATGNLGPTGATGPTVTTGAAGLVFQYATDPATVILQ